MVKDRSSWELPANPLQTALLPILGDQVPDSLALVGRERTLFYSKRQRRQGEFSIERQYGWRCGAERLEMATNRAHIATHLQSSHGGRDPGTLQVDALISHIVPPVSLPKQRIRPHPPPL